MKFPRSILLTLATITQLGSGQVSAQQVLPQWLDSTRRDAARAAAAQNPVGFPLRDYTNKTAGQLGFNADDRFELTRALVDKKGVTHAVLQQIRQGVPVYGAGLIAHRNANGEYLPFTDAGIRNIRTSTRPTLSAASAVALVAADRSHVDPFVTAPTASLHFFPRFERTLASGAPLPPALYDATVPHAMVEAVNAADVVRKLVSTPLAWRIVGVEHNAATDSYRPAYWWVDANKGDILATGNLGSKAGSGSGVSHVSVSFNTRADGSCHVMEDKVRKFRTETEDFASDHPVNCDADNVWGDGAAFVGDTNSPTHANWQSAMVDGHYGATIYWDMMDHVFGYQGPDDDYYSVNLFMHAGTNQQFAAYHSLSGNASFGDGTNGVAFTRTDVIGHELGHAWNDQNSHYGDATMLNESLADIFGEWTEVYLNSGGFASSLPSLGSYSQNPSGWVHSTGRNLENPNASGHPAYWYPKIEDLDEHDASLPASRAFTFLAHGASSWVDASNYSRNLPWGMYGLGLPMAADIYVMTHAGYLLDGNYDNLAAGMIIGAVAQFLNPGGPEEKAARNAYAGINVGFRASGYPPLVIPRNEHEDNDSKDAPEDLPWPGTPPPPGAALPAPHKFKILGGGNDPDHYRMRMTGKKIAVMITPTYTSAADFKPYQVGIVDINGNSVALTAESKHPQVLTMNFPTNKDRLLRVFVLSSSATNGSKYELDIDLDQPPL